MAHFFRMGVIVGALRDHIVLLGPRHRVVLLVTVVVSVVLVTVNVL